MKKDKYTMTDLLKIITILRSPEGCPWDREQTHQSIRANFIEETYEAIEAIDTGNTALLREELGDVLLQILLHCEMEKEIGSFSFDEVANEVAQKLVLRHPHVFGDVEVSSTEDVLKNWDAIKKKSKEQKTQAEVLKSVSPALPALMRSYKVQQKAAKVGYDFSDAKAALDKIGEELAELSEALEQQNPEACAEETGDLLFSAVNLARHLKTEPEKALTDSCNKFIGRFEKAEQLALLRGEQLSELSEQELDLLWEEAKKSKLTAITPEK